LIRSIKYREAFAIIGEKGMLPGQATEDHGTSIDANDELPAGCTAKFHRPTSVVTRTFFQGTRVAALQTTFC